MVKSKVKRVITGIMVSLSLFGAGVHTVSADPYIPKSPQQIREEMQQKENNQGASNQEENKIVPAGSKSLEGEIGFEEYTLGRSCVFGNDSYEHNGKGCTAWVIYKGNNAENQSSAALKIVFACMGLSIELICKHIGLI